MTEKKYEIYRNGAQDYFISVVGTKGNVYHALIRSEHPDADFLAHKLMNYMNEAEIIKAQAIAGMKL